MFAFRSAVEPAAAAEAARNATLDQLYALKSALEVMSEAKSDFAKWLEGDIAFHTALYIASNNVFMAPLANLFRQYFHMSFKVSSSNSIISIACRNTATCSRPSAPRIPHALIMLFASCSIMPTRM